MQQKTLILGATAAIAAEVAKICAERGDELYLVGRNPDKLRAVVAAVGDGVVGFESCDFHEVALAGERVARWIEQLGGLDRALIAHGYLGDQERSEREVSYAQQVIDTNFVSVVSLLMPLANFFASQGRGHLAAILGERASRGAVASHTPRRDTRQTMNWWFSPPRRAYREGSTCADALTAVASAPSMSVLCCRNSCRGRDQGGEHCWVT